jgi:hypothetical protein
VFGKKRNVYKILAGNPQRKRPLGRYVDMRIILKYVLEK